MKIPAVNLLLLSLLAFSAVTVIAFYVLYEQEKIGGLVRLRLSDIKRLDYLATTEESFKGDMNGETDRRERLRSMVLLSEGDTITFLAGIEDIADKVGTTITTSSLQVEKTPDPNFEELSATFSVRGSNRAVERTLELLEVLPYRSRVEKLTLTRTPGLTEAVVTLRLSTLQ